MSILIQPGSKRAENTELKKETIPPNLGCPKCKETEKLLYKASSWESWTECSVCGNKWTTKVYNLTINPNSPYYQMFLEDAEQETPPEDDYIYYNYNI